MKKDVLIKKLKILKNKTRHLMIACGLTGISLGAPIAQSCQNQDTPQQKTTTVVKKAIKNPVATIGYYTDTLYQANKTLLFYLKGKITRNYVEKNETFRISMPYFVHEDWHRHNSKSGFRTTSKLSPYEYYKICIQDEMTANLAAILTARYEYLGAKDKKNVIAKYENSYMGFYFKAIKEKKITPKPLGMDEEERAFLANGVTTMWLETYYRTYAPSLYKMVPRYVERRDLYPSNPNLYKKYVSHFWTIGGIDFSKYLTNDIDERSDERVMMAEDMKNVRSFKKDAPFLVQNITENLHLLKNFANQDQEKALLNLIISAKLKSHLKDKDENNLKYHPTMLTKAYRRVVFELLRDSSFYRFYNKYALVGKNRFNIIEKTENAEEKLRKFYVYKNIDLSKKINDFEFLESIKPTYGTDRNFEKFYFLPDIPSDTLNSDCFVFHDNEQIEDITALHSDTVSLAKGNPPKKLKRKRISSKQCIDIPNFWEPVLSDGTEQSNEAIFQMIDRYNDIPNVLKSCNTEKIEQYKQTHDVPENLFSQKNQAMR